MSRENGSSLKKRWIQLGRNAIWSLENFMQPVSHSIQAVSPLQKQVLNQVLLAWDKDIGLPLKVLCSMKVVL